MSDESAKPDPTHPLMPPRISVARTGTGPIRWQVEGDGAVRKQRGVFFTPWEIAQQLARSVAAALPHHALAEAPTLCDPFAGAGVLLGALVEALLERCADRWGLDESQARTRLLANTHGVDIDPAALAAAQRVLSPGPDSASGSGPRSPGAPRLAALDALCTPLYPPAELTFGPSPPQSWAACFPAVFAGGGFDVVITNPPWEKVRVNDREFFGEFHSGFSRLPRGERDRLRDELLARSEVASAYSAYLERVAATKHAARAQYQCGRSGGDLDLYKLAVERTLELLRPGGVAGLIVPHGLLGDWGARHLRELLFERCEVLEVTRLETGRDFFPEIHANLGVLLMVLCKRPPQGSAIHISPAITDQASLVDAGATAVPFTLVREATPHQMVPLVDCPEDVRFLEACMAFPRLADWPDAVFQPYREVDMTNHRHLFRPVGDGVPLLEGKHLAPYEVALSERRHDVPHSLLRSPETGRIAWRAVADRAMRRRLVAAYVGPGVALGNSLHATDAPADAIAMLWLLSWFNSRVAECQIRLWSANNNINFFHIRSCRVPRFPDDPAARRVAGLARGLTEAPGDDARLEAIEEIDVYWRVTYGLTDRVWAGSVEPKTASVAAW